jgi:hypothetical protein
VYGRSFASNGFGIYGFTGTGETSVAGGFQTERAGGTGVSIRATAATGSGAALDINQSSANGFSLFATGGIAYIGSTRVGIGTTAPDSQLDVTGSVKLRTLNSNPTAATGLVSVDAAGVLSRQPIGGVAGVREFVGAGSTSFFVPNNITRIRVQAWGAGGGANANFSGGSGSYIDWNLSVSPGQQLTIERGTGGFAALGIGTAGNGGATRIINTSNGIVFISCGGGGGAQAAANGSGGIPNPAVITTGTAKNGFDGRPGVCVSPAYLGPVGDFSPTGGYPVFAGSGGESRIASNAPLGGLAGAVIITW